ncbi:50S ribosomal protein L11 [Candidatus Pacearchaeota archaeon]|nr:50S ribosomal protein L11 [Candidatus Pacearchaeota archaeon]
MQIKLLVEGGSMSPGPALSQKLGPLGMNIAEIIQKVNDATKDFKGLKVPVELEIDTKTKEFEVNVFSPPVSELLKKELGIEKGSGIQLKMQIANASIEQIISIAKTKFPNMLCNDLKSAVKTVVGTCVSLGILVENKSALDVEKLIDAGKYDKEIQEERTETFPEKRAKLDKYFNELHTKQEKVIEQEEAEKEVAKTDEESKEATTEEVKPEEDKEEKK